MGDDSPRWSLWISLSSLSSSVLPSLFAWSLSSVAVVSIVHGWWFCETSESNLLPSPPLTDEVEEAEEAEEEGRIVDLAETLSSLSFSTLGAPRSRSFLASLLLRHSTHGKLARLCRERDMDAKEVFRQILGDGIVLESETKPIFSFVLSSELLSDAVLRKQFFNLESHMLTKCVENLVSCISEEDECLCSRVLEGPFLIRAPFSLRDIALEVLVKLSVDDLHMLLYSDSLMTQTLVHIIQEICEFDPEFIVSQCEEDIVILSNERKFSIFSLHFVSLFLTALLRSASLCQTPHSIVLFPSSDFVSCSNVESADQPISSRVLEAIFSCFERLSRTLVLLDGYPTISDRFCHVLASILKNFSKILVDLIHQYPSVMNCTSTGQSGWISRARYLISSIGASKHLSPLSSSSTARTFEHLLSALGSFFSYEMKKGHDCTDIIQTHLVDTSFDRSTDVDRDSFSVSSSSSLVETLIFLLNRDSADFLDIHVTISGFLRNVPALIDAIAGLRDWSPQFDSPEANVVHSYFFGFDSFEEHHPEYFPLWLLLWKFVCFESLVTRFKSLGLEKSQTFYKISLSHECFLALFLRILARHSLALILSGEYCLAKLRSCMAPICIRLQRSDFEHEQAAGIMFENVMEYLEALSRQYKANLFE